MRNLTTETNYNSTENHAGAFLTCRLLDNRSDQEWKEICTLDGERVSIFYEFTEEEASSEDAGDYPWDFDHVTKIELIEK